MAHISPRPDQIVAQAAIISALDAGVSRPLAVAPMAWGKSVLIGMLVRTLLARGRRVLVLAHRRELLEQNAGVLRRLDADLDAGVMCAGLGRDDADSRALIASTATAYRRLGRIGAVDVIVLDEAHLCGPGTSTMLATIREGLGDPPLVGLTATPFRGDGSLLVEAGLFDAIAHETSLRQALDAGQLCPLVTKAPKSGRIDTSGVPVVAGEFHARALEAAAMAGDTTRRAIERTVEVARAERRRSWLIFSSGVNHAGQIAEELRRLGVSTAVIVGTTPAEERDAAIEAFRAGDLTALVNAFVLTTGFDATRIDLVAFLRATCSPVLWVQSSGRGMRLHPDKVDCRLLDYGGNLQRHGPIDNVRLRAKGERHDAAAAASTTRICPQCDEANDRSAEACACCGFIFVKRQLKPIDTVESDLAAISSRDGWAWVHGGRAHVHHKPGSSPSFRLTFVTSAGRVDLFLALEHWRDGARWHAGRRWRDLSRTPHRPPPSSVAEAFARFRAGELRCPARVRVIRNGQWPEIADLEFPLEAEAAA